MQDNINLESRKKRMSSLFSGKNNLRDEGLVKVCAINEKSINCIFNFHYWCWNYNFFKPRMAK